MGRQTNKLKDTYEAAKLQASKEGEQITDTTSEEIKRLIRAIEIDANKIDLLGGWEEEDDEEFY